MTKPDDGGASDPSVRPERPGPVERQERWGSRRRGGPWAYSAMRDEDWSNGWRRDGPPWAAHRGRFMRRFAGFLFVLVLLLTLVLVVAGWLAASLLGLLGPGFGGGAPHIVAGRFVLGLLVIVGIVAIALRGVRRFAQPLDELSEATRRVAGGDYSARVVERPRGTRELRELARGFNTMAARLEANERQRRSLLSDVSHELRTPLAVVQGNIEAIVDGVHPADEAHLGSILEETRVLGRLIDDLRTLALSEAGTLSLHREPTDLDVLITDVARSQAAVAQAASVALVADVSDDLPIVEVDPVRIREVVGNLVGNAVRYTAAGRTVTIAAWASGEGQSERVRVEVRDTGPGLAPEVAATAFDRFAKSSDSRGSGLGLAIAKQLVEAHGGAIGLDSRPGAGTTAWFELPTGGQPTGA